MTKLQLILQQNDMSQAQLIELIKEKTGKTIGKDRISKICSGKITNYSLRTAKIISISLGIPIDKFIEHRKLLNK